jgi:cytochrome b561
MDATRQMHETLGVLVFAAVLLRIIWRWSEEGTEHAGMAPWMKSLSKFVHLLLYVLLTSIPVTAIAGTWLQGHPLTLLAVSGVGPFLPYTPNIGLAAMNIHTTLGNVILWVSGVHAAAALGHHFLLRDRVLISMLPARPRG